MTFAVLGIAAFYMVVFIGVVIGKKVDEKERGCNEEEIEKNKGE